jgi:hypothetical protein
MGGERRHLTVLFAISSARLRFRRGSIPKNGAKSSEAIIRFGGYVAKYLGDGVMAYFGWPESHDNDAERAARAGLAILEGLAWLKQSRREK